MEGSGDSGQAGYTGSATAVAVSCCSPKLEKSAGIFSTVDSQSHDDGVGMRHQEQQPRGYEVEGESFFAFVQLGRLSIR